MIDTRVQQELDHWKVAVPASYHQRLLQAPSGHKPLPRWSRCRGQASIEQDMQGFCVSILGCEMNGMEPWAIACNKQKAALMRWWRCWGRAGCVPLRGLVKVLPRIYVAMWRMEDGMEHCTLYTACTCTASAHPHTISPFPPHGAYHVPKHLKAHACVALAHHYLAQGPAQTVDAVSSLGEQLWHPLRPPSPSSAPHPQRS